MVRNVPFPALITRVIIRVTVKAGTEALGVDSGGSLPGSTMSYGSR